MVEVNIAPVTQELRLGMKHAQNDKHRFVHRQPSYDLLRHQRLVPHFLRINLNHSVGVWDLCEGISPTICRLRLGTHAVGFIRSQVAQLDGIYQFLIPPPPPQLPAATLLCAACAVRLDQ